MREKLASASEAIWLTAAFVVPLAIAPEGSLFDSNLIVKVISVRTLALAMVVTLAAQWAVTQARESSGLPWAGPVAAIGAHPAKWIVYAAAAVLSANVISAGLSPIPAISVLGDNVNTDAYGVANVAAYAVIAGGIAINMRSRAAVMRLLWVLIAVSMLTSAYAVVQRLGWDVMRTDPSPVTRPGMTFGNPIFAGAFLVMTIPLALAAVLTLRPRLSSLQHLWIGIAVMALPLSALVLALSRGPWLGLGASIAAVAAVFAWVGMRAELRRALAVLVIAGAIALVPSLLPGSADSPSARGAFIDRVESVAPDVTSNPRLKIWRSAADAFVSPDWIDTELYPEIPALDASSLRP